MIIATQRPSVNIITGVIKANFPARLAFKVASKVDSRTILDAGGAEQLTGRGDMLLSVGGDIIRLQSAFVDTPETERVIDFIAKQQGFPEPFFLPEFLSEEGEGSLSSKSFSLAELDDLYEDAAKLVVETQHGSTSMIQRRMKLGYNRAGRIMDQLESLGIVGPAEGSKPREVLYFTMDELMRYLTELRNKRFER
jgi:S-DNA-T family DNA segregation ATPase FtsK/SpoIIIE